MAGHPGIFKKGGRYLVHFRYKGRQKARSFRTLSEADRFKGKVMAGDAQPTSREPFKRYAARWIESYTGRTASGVGNSTRASYADALARIAMPYFGTTRMDEIDAPMLRDFIASLAAKKLSPSTIRRYYAPVRALLATAYEDGLIRRVSGSGTNLSTVANHYNGAMSSTSLKVPLSPSGQHKRRPLKVKVRVGFFPKKKGAPTSVAYATVVFR